MMEMACHGNLDNDKHHQGVHHHDHHVEASWPGAHPGIGSHVQAVISDHVTISFVINHSVKYFI